MKSIPTAEEFFSENNGLYTAYSVKNKEGKFTQVCSFERAIEFAKLHVEAALKEASEKAELKAHGAHTDKVDSGKTVYEWRSNDDDYIWSIDEDSILNAYPLSKIK